MIWNPFLMSNLYADIVMNTKPPTLYAIMNSMANYESEEYTKVRDLAKATHSRIFDFQYNLSNKIDKNEFEINILNHFIMRRINYDTFIAFQLYLENKLNEILPFYNTLFDSLTDYNLFESGEHTHRTNNDLIDIENNSESDTENRYSEYPQNRLNDIRSGSYVTNQNLAKGNGKTTQKGNNNTVEDITKSPSDKMSVYKNYLETKNSIMTMIYKELESLFYQIVD